METIYKLTLRKERVALAESVEAYRKTPIRSAAALAPLLHSVLDPEPHEVFLAVALDAKNRVLGYHEIARGGATSCAVDAAAVWRAVLLSGAVGVIFSHNHPSGDVAPSPEDVAITRRLVQAGALLGVRVVDHVIVGDDGHFSFLDAGLIGVNGGGAT
jgi:DNA repair protein RadC